MKIKTTQFDCILERIVNQLPFSHDKIQQLPIGLFNGLGGVALLLAVLYNLTLAEKYKAAMRQVVDHISFRIKHESIDFTFGEGIAGLGWLYKFLLRKGFIPKEQLLIFNDLDSRALESIHDFRHDLNYNLDFIYGNTGVALYLLSRLPSPFIKSGLEGYISYASKTKVLETDNTIKWVFERRINNQQMKVADISISHGMSSIIIMLNNIRKKGIGIDETTMMIRLGVQFILNQKNANYHASLYPSYSREIESESTFSRLAWCYGDLCVANMLHSVKTIDHKESYTNAINAILSHSNTRLSGASSLCVDSNFCHGYSGVLYILHKLKYANNYTIISDDNILYWRNVLIKRLETEIECQYSENNAIRNWGLLQGMSGIALVLLSLKHSYYEWDECLLLS